MANYSDEPVQGPFVPDDLPHGGARVAIVDLDHTLADCFWRDDLIGDWDAYHSESCHDKPIHDIVAMVRSLHADGWLLVGMTCRTERWRQVSMRWLLDHDIPLDELIMRPDDDFRPSREVKPDLLKARFPDPSEVNLVIDDRADIAEVFSAENMTVLQVYPRRGKR